jgi:hypothetical protein
MMAIDTNLMHSWNFSRTMMLQVDDVLKLCYTHWYLVYQMMNICCVTSVHLCMTLT